MVTWCKYGILLAYHALCFLYSTTFLISHVSVVFTLHVIVRIWCLMYTFVNIFEAMVYNIADWNCCDHIIMTFMQPVLSLHAFSILISHHHHSCLHPKYEIWLFIFRSVYNCWIIVKLGDMGYYPLWVSLDQCWNFRLVTT